MTDQTERPFDRTRPLDTAGTAGPPPAAEPAPAAAAESAEPARPAAPRQRTLLSDLRTGPPQRAAIVVLVGIGVLTIAFIIMIFVNVSSASINALAVIATPIASMVAAYYAVTLSIHQVTAERAEKERVQAKLEGVEAGARENEIWASQMESGLRVAMAKLHGAGINTDAVTRAAGTPDDFF